ncbi:MAG: hypothetical protein ACTHKT_07120 [Solirubrobacterales bacterium]
MAVMAREAWTDERLDDLKENVNQRFDEVDKRFDRVEGEMKARFEQVDKRFDRVEGDIRELRTDMKQGFESMHRTMVIGFVTLFASIVASVIGATLALG